MVKQTARPPRPPGRPPMTEEQRAAKEPEIDMHLKLPKSLVKLIDAEQKRVEGQVVESRKDCIVRLLRERLQAETAIAKEKNNA